MTANANLELVDRFNATTGLKPVSVDPGARTAIYKKVDLRNLLNIDFSGSYFDFVEDDAAIDAMIANFAAFVCDHEREGIRIFTRAPIGSGFKVELRVCEQMPPGEFLTAQKVKRKAKGAICELEGRGTFSVLSLSGSSMVGFVHTQVEDPSGYARECLDRFPRLDEHFNSAMPKRVDPIALIANELRKSRTFFLKW